MHDAINERVGGFGGELNGFGMDVCTLLECGIAPVSVGCRNPLHDSRLSEAECSIGVGELLKSAGSSSGFTALAGVVEFFEDLALLLRILTRIVAALSPLWMLSTTWLAVGKMKKKYAGGCELDITLMLSALALAALGGGTFSPDHLLGI